MTKEPNESINATLPITWAAINDTGKVRQENQDALFADPKSGLFLVSDGMGGLQAGALAAKIVTQVLPAIIANKLKNLKSHGTKAVRAMLKKAILELSRQMRIESANQMIFKGMGATLVMALLRDNRAYIANMGDSRAYLFRNDKLSQLSEDHSVIALLLRTGEITDREARCHPARGQLSRYIGMLDEVDPFLRKVTLKENDRLLLCSDGLTGVVRDNEIAAILHDHADPQDACKALVESANLFGGPDNITALIVDWHSGNGK